MIDEKTKTASYEMGGRQLLMRELTVGQYQKLAALQGRVEAENGEGLRFTIFTDPVLVAELLSIVLKDEQGQTVTITADDVRELPGSTLGEMMNDFFGLNPILQHLLTTFLASTLSSGEATKGADGKDRNSGSTLPLRPPAGISVNGNG